MSQLKPRVAVIGAGPAGAITVDALVKEQAFSRIRVFERQSFAGGTWNQSPDPHPKIPSLRALLTQRANLPIPLPSHFPCVTPLTPEINCPSHRFTHTGAHSNLHSNIPPSIMCFTQEPIPGILSASSISQYGVASPFRHKDVVRDWVAEIISKGGYEGLVEYSATVERAEKDGEVWVLSLRKEVAGVDGGAGKNAWWQERFDKLVVATGHYYLPYIPEIPGLIEYEEMYPGRIRHSKYYRDVEEYREKTVIVVGGSISAFDALHAIRQVSNLPILSSIRNPEASVFGPAAFTHPAIERHSEISCINPETRRVSFSDRTFIDHVDIILFATGYQFSFPFLPQLEIRNGRIPGLYQHVFKNDDTSLAFIGMVTGGFGLRIFEWQAVLTARIFASHAQLPSHSEMQSWEATRILKTGDGPAFWALMPDFEMHFESLRKLAGDPRSGTMGRVLPRYEEEWADIMWEFVEMRRKWWEKEAVEAEVDLGRLVRVAS